MQLSLANLLSDAVTELQVIYGAGSTLPMDQLMLWMEKYPAQLVTLAVQVAWTAAVEASLEAKQSPEGPLQIVTQALNLLADIVLQELSPVTRRKCEHLITELVHQRDVTQSLILERVLDTKGFTWLYQMRFYLDRAVENLLERLAIKVADASFPYGWEYLGVPDRLVQTAAHRSAKPSRSRRSAYNLADLVLVFCCDETFDFQAMGRIFVGLCQVGAWGCFDEFNRLEERILSAVSQQVQSIQQGPALLVKNPNTELKLTGKNLKINKNIGFPAQPNLWLPRSFLSSIFATSGSSHRNSITTLVCVLSKLSWPVHCTGILKRERLQSVRVDAENGEDTVVGLSDSISEQIIVIQSVTETIVPKLVADDVPLLTNLLADVFPGVDCPSTSTSFREQILNVCAERRLIDDERWIAKILQLYQIQKIQHGLMMVGPSGSGKTNAWQVLLAALEQLNGIEGKIALRRNLHVLDGKKLLTLPNRERLNLPPNVQIMFEVEHLKYATLATVSRCVMLWAAGQMFGSDNAAFVSLITQKRVASMLERYFGDGDLHIMDFTVTRDLNTLNTLFSLLNKTVRNVIKYNFQHPDFPLSPEHVEHSLIDYDVQVANGEWTAWQSKVPIIESEAHAITVADVGVPTIDTVHHEEVLYSWLSEHKPLMLCGPPGSGKMMTLFSALRKLPDMEVAGLNFSSATMPELILKTFEQYCECHSIASITYDVSKPLTEPGTIDVYSDVDNIHLVPLVAVAAPDPPPCTIELEVSFDTMDDGTNHTMFNLVTYNSPLMPTVLSAMTIGGNATDVSVYGPQSFEHMDVLDIVVKNGDARKHHFHIHGHKYQVVACSSDYTSENPSLITLDKPAPPKHHPD
ncbi:hypothetical protein B0H14DRAFT_3725952 [Mycena olivaceomarginata]|nr:hypothetical protein B0H14DRAFT_3725952 [Mycena olivaceomarginata]